MITDKLKAKVGFSEVEKNIADYLLEKGREMKSESARQIAGKVFTSPASITRLCQKLGYSGFSIFKEDYLKEIDYLESHFHDIDPNFPFAESDSQMRVSHKIAELYKETIADVSSLLTMEELRKFMAVIKKAKTIYIVSFANHRYLAYPFQEKMATIGKKVNIISQIDMAFYQASLAEKEDCFLFISYSGEHEHTLRTAVECKNRGIHTVCLTSYGNNSLSRICDHSLYVSTREKLITNVGNYGIYLSVLYLLDTIYSIYFNMNYQPNLDNKIAISKHCQRSRWSGNPILKEM